MAFFFCPNTHCDRWNKDQHDPRVPVVQLVKRGQVLIEKVVWPKRSERCQKDKDAKEYVAGRIAKVRHEVAFHDRKRGTLGARKQGDDRKQKAQENRVQDKQIQECENDVVERHGWFVGLIRVGEICDEVAVGSENQMPIR